MRFACGCEWRWGVIKKRKIQEEHRKHRSAIQPLLRKKSRGQSKGAGPPMPAFLADLIALIAIPNEDLFVPRVSADGSVCVCGGSIGVIGKFFGPGA